MAFSIGFTARHSNGAAAPAAPTAPQNAPRKSLVDVVFAGCERALTYYNDRFDLHQGDLVFVDGKLAGQRGRVAAVHYSFKIRASDYKRILAVADLCVHGTFHAVCGYFVTFDPAVLPPEQVTGWYLPPEDADDIVVCSGSGPDDGICLDTLKGFSCDEGVAARGKTYYLDSRVRYLRLCDTRGYAIVEGTQSYTVEFRCEGGMVYDLLCTCPCAGICKHELAVLLQLRDLLQTTETHFSDAYRRSSCFTAIAQDALFFFAIQGRENTTITL